MNVALTPSETILMSWEQYVSRNFNRAFIPWDRYRYSKKGVVEVSGEVRQNADIAGNLFSELKSEIKRSGTDWKCYMNSISLEVELSDKEERIPDLIVITQETFDLIGPESRIVTLDMPAPILVVEVVSPSSMATDLKAKELEYLYRRVGEYVSIDWRNQIVIVRSRNEDGASYNYNEFKAGETVALTSFPDLNVTVDEIIAG